MILAFASNAQPDSELMTAFRSTMEWIGTGIDAMGVLVILLGLVGVTWSFLLQAQRDGVEASYTRYRQGIGRAILLGLEFLVAGDIIRTVVVAPTLENVIVLGLIILARSFLSIALEVELEGRWPWQRPAGAADRTPSRPRDAAASRDA